MLLRDEGYKEEKNETVYITKDVDKAHEAESGSCELFKKEWGAVEMTEEDEKITLHDVLRLQPHIDKRELLVGIVNYKYEDDSYEDFESFSNRHD